MKVERELSNIPRFQRQIARPSLEYLAAKTDLSKKEARTRFALSAVKDNGYSQSAVARFLGVHQSTVCKWVGSD
jgi:DNA-binding MarR family transcriptional regulator